MFGAGLSDAGLSIVATPDAIRLSATGNEDSAVVPDLLKLVIEQSSSKSSRPAASASRMLAPLRMTLHTREFKTSGVEVAAIVNFGRTMSADLSDRPDENE